MSFDFANTFAADFGEKLKIDSKIEDETDEIEYKPQFVKKKCNKKCKAIKKK